MRELGFTQIYIIVYFRDTLGYLNSHCSQDHKNNIKAISIVLPKNPHTLEKELQECNLNQKKYELLKQNTGINHHFISPNNLCK